VEGVEGKKGVLRDRKVLGPNPKCMADERQKLYSTTCIKLCHVSSLWRKNSTLNILKTQWKGKLRALHKMLFQGLLGFLSVRIIR